MKRSLARALARAGVIVALFVLAASPAEAASFAGTQTGPNEWTYTLTYDPQDNYAVCPAPGDVAKITLSGLAGVVNASAPTSTDFEDPDISTINLAWAPQVSGGGTVVTWTHQGSGTGNPTVAKHVLGFKVLTATPVPNGTVNVASDGFSFDVSVSGPCPVQPQDDRDFTATTNGPAAFPPTVTSAVTDLGRPFGAAVRNGVAYVPDPSGHRVWQIDLATGNKSVVAGTGEQGFNGDGIDATLAQLDNPSGVAVDTDGALYIADTGNHVVRKIAQPGVSGALITTIAGIPTLYAVGESTLPQCANPPSGFDTSQCLRGTQLRLFGPRGVAVDGANRVYIADRMNQQIKRLDPATGYLFVIGGIAGVTGNSNGSGVCLPTDIECFAATFNSPVGVAVDVEGARVYVADEGNNSVRVIDAGFVSNFVTGPLLRPTGVAVANNGDIYVADYGRHRIQRIPFCGLDCDGPTVVTVAGVDNTPGSSPPTGPATSVLLNSPIGVAFDAGVLYIADMVNGRLLGVTIAP
jgi:YVTN family beta-propeller protein